MGKCTVPRLFGLKDWFDRRFGDLCAEHDRRYMLREGSKTQADLVLAKAMWKRGYRSLAVGTFVMCQTPYAFWLWYT